LAKKAKKKAKAQRKEPASEKVEARDKPGAAEAVVAPPAGRLRSFMGSEGAIYLVLVLIALIIRLWELDVRPYHYDEAAHHILKSFHLYQGSGYAHDPMSHGPFQYFGTALIYHIFGDNDFTARLLPALLGTAMVGLPFLLRRQLGRLGAFAAALLITFSPLLLYYSRYARNDIYDAFWALLVVVCIWRYFENSKARYLYIGAAALSLDLCTKEVSYITIVILGLFLLFTGGRELAGSIINRFSLKGLSPRAEFLLVLGTLCLPLYSGFIQVIPGVELASGFHWAKMLVFLIFLIPSVIIGLMWNWRRWLLSAFIFYGIFFLLYTSFFGAFLPENITVSSRLSSGLWGSVDYWVEQHDVARGGQPWFFYLMFIPIYEFLALLFATIGAVYYTVKGNTFSRFLVYWSILSLIAYSFAGEKMPWLSLHIALPAILLGSMFIGQVLESCDWRRVKPRLAPIVSQTATYLGAVFVVLAVSIAIGSTSHTIAIPVFLIIGFIMLALGIGGNRKWGWTSPRLVQGATMLLIIVLFFCTMYTALQESYQRGEDPPQMLLYAGISSDVPRYVDRIEELAEKTGLNKNYPITIDFDVYYYGWAWYLRHYKYDHNKSEPTGKVLALHDGNKLSGDEPYRDNYGEAQRCDNLMWFPEVYKYTIRSFRNLYYTDYEYKTGDEINVIGLSDQLMWWWDYFLNREVKTENVTPENPYGNWSQQTGWVYFPN